MGAAGLLFLLFFRHFGFGIPCIFHRITGLKCPGCGMTHAVSALLQGKVREAKEYNLLSVLFLPPFAVLFTYHIVRYVKDGKTEIGLIEDGVYVIMLFITIAYGVARNLAIIP